MPIPAELRGVQSSDYEADELPLLYLADFG
jgi:hypothetical protein